MKRGDIVTVAAGSGFGGKPRPAVVIQADEFDTPTIILCLFTSNPRELPLFRPEIEPAEGKGLTRTSRLMVDKIVSVPKDKVGQHIGRLPALDVLRLNRALAVFLGLAG